MKQFGPHAMAEMMRKMGITSYIEEVPSLCTGPSDLSLFEMVAAYNTFPSKGIYVSPMFVTRIEDNQGNVISDFVNKKREAISEQTAYIMACMMQNVVNNGTGVRLRYKYGIKAPIGGKTGTTNESADGWFIGYTPTITAGVWCGAEDRQVHFQSGYLGQGANMALPIWALFYKKVVADGTLGISENDNFVGPAGLTVDMNCNDSGSEKSIKSESEEAEYYFD